MEGTATQGCDRSATQGPEWQGDTVALSQSDCLLLAVEPLSVLRLIVHIYRRRLSPVFMMAILVAQFYASGQLVQIGPLDPHACEKVKVIPNLLLETSVDIAGQVRDPSGAPMIGTRIEVRKYVSALKQSPFKQTLTDADGRFSISTLPAGKYRLVIFAPGFRQPRVINCAGGRTCDLKIVPEIAPTDTFPESVCPPK